jgi:negative regulator of flagellin synthesis FlgM
MKPIDISGPNGITPRAVASPATPVTGAEPARRVRGDDGAAAGGNTLSPHSAGDLAPVDAERVAEIRRAIEQGRYPVIPMRIADAMIAAGLLLRTK